MRYFEYREKQNHGTAEFPVAYYHISANHPRYEMSYHWHMECEIIRIIQGALKLTVDNEMIVARAGEVVYIAGGALHGGIPEDCVYECMVFHLERLAAGNKICERLLRGVFDHTVALPLCFGKTDAVVWTITTGMFEKLYGRKEGYELGVIGALYDFYGCVLGRKEALKAPAAAKKQIRRMTQLKEVFRLIETSYNTNISLKELAEAACMNEKYFCRFFKAMTQRTPIDYLNYYRIECACTELVLTGNSITEIAFNCGFNDVSYFITIFKKYKGVTPKKYVSGSIGGV